MNRVVFLLALPVLACATAPAPRTTPAPFSRRDLVRHILSQNVRLFIYEGKQPVRSASGVVIASEIGADGSSSYVLTNAHVVDVAGMKEPRLTALVDQLEGDAMEYQADPVAVGSVPEMDLALVRVWGVQLKPAELAEDAEVIPGDSVIVAGAPFGRPVSVSGGMVSQIELDPKTHQARILKTDAPIGYGASGGGVYSLETGHLLAIVEGYRTAKVGFEVATQSYSFDVPMPGETFAAPVAKVRTFLEGKGYQRFLPSAPSQAASR